MLNLSDKELDRLSREAAQEHDPGDVIGPQSWEKLEIHLDKDLGRVNPNPFRGIRRLPFYYAPAILLILGVGYYFVKQSKTRKAEHSGSPPVTMVNPQKNGEPSEPTNEPFITKNPATNDSSNSTPKDPTTAQYPAASGQPTASGQPAAPGQPLASGESAAAPSPANVSSSGNGKSTPGRTVTSPGRAPASATATGRSVTTSPGTRRPDGTLASNTPSLGNKYTPSASGNRRNASGNRSLASGNRSHISGNHTNPDGNRRQVHSVLSRHDNGQIASRDGSLPADAQSSGDNNNILPSGATRPRELNLSAVQQARSRRSSPAVDDSGLRAFTAKTSPVLPLKKIGILRINRSLQLGLSLAPDFASVNSLAGDRPGSSIGLTLDYRFANRWYLGTGLLFSRKNYAARAQDYHAPYDFYRANNLHNVDFVKGSFNMLEIPLNLRYDFSVTGNTVFFASAGLSSFFFASESCNYYFSNYGREDSKGFHYPKHENSLFTTANLSLGVEAGISNSLSLLVAPYMKIPTRNMGFGQIQMNSVGINFALKFTPVLSRKRR